MQNRLKQLIGIGWIGTSLVLSHARELSKTVILKQPIELTIFHQGKTVGQMTLPANRKVEVLSQSNEWLIVQSGMAQGKVLIQNTDFDQQSRETNSLVNQQTFQRTEEKKESPWHINRSLSSEAIQNLVTKLYQEGKTNTLLQEFITVLQTNAATASANPTWIEHLRFAQAIALWQGADDLTSSIDQETATALFQNKLLLESLGSTISPLDKPKEVWKILADLQKTFPDQIKEYHALAIALAVVHDEFFPTNWPSDQAGVIPRKDGNWTELFRYFTEQDKKNRLFLKLTKLEADQLKFVVDAPVALSEFEWAHKNVKFSRGEFDRSYFFVNYDDDRLTKQIYDWPWPETYTLENITKRNGICIDQAYFSFLSGKAKGLPTLVFSGAGKAGYHAWFGYMKADDRWEMNAGRYANDNYVVGDSIDPQTRQRITDHQLQIISSQITSTPNYQQSQNLLLLIDLTAFLNPSLSQKTSLAQYKNILQSALKICPANTETWLRLSNWLEKNGTTEESRSHYTAMIEQFKNQQDLKAWAQEKLSQIARASGDIATAETLQKSIMQENRRDRTDLGVATATQLLQQKIEKNDYDSAFTEFCRIVRSYKKDGGGALFFDLVDPFIRGVHEKGESEIAKKALRFAQNTMDYNHDPTSQIQQGFQSLCDLLNVKMKD